MARILGVRRVIVPLAAGVLSAVGCLTAPLSFEAVRSLPSRLTATDWQRVNALYHDMETWGRANLQAAGIAPQQIQVMRSADMRLAGQIHELNVPVPDGLLSEAHGNAIAAQFHRLYQELYSRQNLSIPIEVQNWRLRLQGPKPPVHLRQVAMTDEVDASVACKGTRQVYFRSAGGYRDCAVYDRYRLSPGCVLPGPAIVEERESTAVIGPQDAATVDPWLNLLIQVG